MRSTGMLPEVFVGRVRELNELQSALKAAISGRAEQTIMYGSFGIGKTSILIKFKEENKGSASIVRIPLYVTDNITEICDLILRESRSQLHLRSIILVERLMELGFTFLGVSANLTLAKVEMNPQSALKSIFETIYDAGFKKKPLVFLMDDLHRICGEKSEKSRTILSILSNVLLQMNQEGKKIMFVGTGTYDIFKFIREQDESSVRIFHPLEIKPLTREEVAEALTTSARKLDVRIDKGVMDNVYECSEGIPYYVQILGYYCFEERENKSITQESFRSGYERTLTDLADKDFRNIFNQLSRTAKNIVTFISENDENAVKYGDIKEHIGSEVSNYLGELMEKNILEKKERGEYSIRDRMFREFLRLFRPNSRT